ncbi:hypothetical protein niasHT_009937 [Heterodera trifolii]|uniref:Peptidase S1 domain-containing protein n=1 Tax=Heterodera trifolii TaxID=157864 RepID=A0ABD2MDY0_9BILA
MDMKLRTAGQNVERAAAGVELAWEQKRDADAELAAADAAFKLAQQRLNAAKNAAENANTALDAADAERLRVIDELEKNQKLQRFVNQQLMKIEVSRQMNAHHYEDISMKSGHREAVEALIQIADKHYTNLYRLKRKLLLDREIEELVKARDLNKYKHEVDAVTFRPLVDIRDKILYLSTKHFGLELEEIEADAHRRCMADGSTTPSYRQRFKAGLKRLNSVGRSSSRNDDQSQLLSPGSASRQQLTISDGGLLSPGTANRQQLTLSGGGLLSPGTANRQQLTLSGGGLLSPGTGSGSKQQQQPQQQQHVGHDLQKQKPTELVAYVARAVCLYTDIFNRMTEEERQSLNETMSFEESLTGQKNIELVGQKLDAQVEKKVKSLIADQHIREYPTDQRTALNMPTLHEFLRLEQGESSAMGEKKGAIVALPGSLDEMAQTLIEAEQPWDDGTDQFQGFSQLQRGRTLKDMFSRSPLTPIIESSSELRLRSESENSDQMYSLEFHALPSPPWNDKIVTGDQKGDNMLIIDQKMSQESDQKHSPSKLADQEHSPSKLADQEHSPSKLADQEHSPSKLADQEHSPSKLALVNDQKLKQEAGHARRNSTGSIHRGQKKEKEADHPSSSRAKSIDQRPALQYHPAADLYHQRFEKDQINQTTPAKARANNGTNILHEAQTGGVKANNGKVMGPKTEKYQVTHALPAAKAYIAIFEVQYRGTMFGSFFRHFDSVPDHFVAFVCWQNHLAKHFLTISPSLIADFSALPSSTPELPCHNFRRSYVAHCDWLEHPFRDEVIWDIERIYFVHSQHELDLNDFNHLPAKDLQALIGAVQFSGFFTGISATAQRLQPEHVDALLALVRRSHSLRSLRLCRCTVPKDFVAQFAAALALNASLPLERLRLGELTIEDRKAVQLDRLWSALKLGGLGLEVLRLGGCYCSPSSSKRSGGSAKDSAQVTRELFAAVHSLRELNLSGTHVGPELLQGILDGLSANSHLAIGSLHLCLDSAIVGSAACVSVLEQHIGDCACVGSLSLRDNALEYEVCAARCSPREYQPPARSSTESVPFSESLFPQSFLLSRNGPVFVQSCIRRGFIQWRAKLTAKFPASARQQQKTESECPLKCGRRAIQQEQRDFGGTVVEQDLWPWTFLLSATECDGKNSYCTAQYIGENYFATSAHCLYTNFFLCHVNPRREKRPTWVPHETDKLELSSHGETYHVDEFWVDPRFEENDNTFQNYAYDFALIKSSTTVYAEPVCLASRLDRFKDSWGNLVGYGLHSTDAEWDQKLRHATVNLSPSAICKLKWGASGKLCSGSSNAGALIGILSMYRRGNSRQNNPEIYAPVADFCGFIASVTGSRVKCTDPYNAITMAKCKKATPEGAVDA